MAEVTPKVLEVLKESPQVEITLVAEDILWVPGVFKESPQID